MTRREPEEGSSTQLLHSHALSCSKSWCTDMCSCTQTERQTCSHTTLHCSCESDVCSARRSVKNVCDSVVVENVVVPNRLKSCSPMPRARHETAGTWSL